MNSEEVPKMSVKEFRAFGYLQELNRRFLHPLGLALEVVIGLDGEEHFGEVWDGREDPTGFIYGPDTMLPEKAQRVYTEMGAREHLRYKKYGFVIQPEDQ